MVQGELSAKINIKNLIFKYFMSRKLKRWSK